MKTVKLPIDIFEIAWWVHNVGGIPTKAQIIIDGYDVRADKDLKYIIVVLFHDVRTNKRYKYDLKDAAIYMFESDADRKVRHVRLRRDRISPCGRQYKDEWE